MTNEIVRLDYDKEYYPQIRAVLNADKAPDSVLETAVEYCKAAGLDIMRKPVAIIGYGGNHQIVFTIQAITTIASRAGWCGSDEIHFSDELVTVAGKQYPAYGYQVVYKMIGGQRCPFTGPKVYLQERHKNSWSNAGVMAMYQKCVTAAALRLAFPEQLAHAYEESEIYEPQVPVDNTGIETLRQSKKPEPVQEEIIEAEATVTNDDSSSEEEKEMLKSIQTANNMEELKEIKNAIIAFNPQGDMRTRLQQAYMKKERELMND